MSPNVAQFYRSLWYCADKNIETVSCPCNTCFWYARALAVRNTSQSGAEWCISYNIFIANLQAIFNYILRKILTIYYAKTMGLSFIADVVQQPLWQWASLSWCVFLNSVRPMRSTPFNSFSFWVIFCHITLERSWVIGFCLHFRWMYVATAITYSEQSPSWVPAQTNWCNRSSRDEFSDQLFQNDTNRTSRH